MRDKPLENLAFEIVRNRIAAGKSRFLIGVSGREDELAWLKSRVRASAPLSPETHINFGLLQEDAGTVPWHLVVTSTDDSVLLHQAARNSDELIVLIDERNESTVSLWGSQLSSSGNCRVRVLKKKARKDSHVLVVLGNSDSTGELSRVGQERLEAARELASGDGVDLVLFCGGAKSHALAEAVQMEAQFSSQDVPTLTDEASTITAENAVSTKALLGALGGVSKLTVVTSDWHRFRAWIYFAKLFRLERCEVKIAAAGPDSASFRDRLSEVRWMTHIPRNVRQAKRLLG